MSSEGSEEETETEVLFLADVEVVSEDDPPMSEWSSLILKGPERNLKRHLHEEGLYTPGSGEVCAKYIAQSQSSVFRHPYYNYPAVSNPGITAALLVPEPQVIYPEDGQAQYLALCKEMEQCPVRTFHSQLLTDKIDLKYYCVNPFGVRAMAIALQYNKYVKSIDLTDNFLNDDACFHLGEMLICNSTLTEINLSGCRIGPRGTKMLCAGLNLNKNLRILNLDKNEIGDTGIEHLAHVIFSGIGVTDISLSKNNITGKSMVVLAETFETRNKFKRINLSWNNLYSPPIGVVNLLAQLAENKDLLELDLSWNSLSGPRIAGAIKNVMRAPNLKVLNLNNNRFNTDVVIESLIGSLGKAKKLVSFDISYNPLTPEDALMVLNKLKSAAVKVQNVNMDNIFVNGAFLELLGFIKKMKSKKNLVVTYGGVVSAYTPKGPDMRDLVLNRAEFLMKKPKKKMDIALVVLQMFKDLNRKEVIPAKIFQEEIGLTGAPLDGDLIDEIINAFPGPKKGKEKLMDLFGLVDFLRRKWPERRLPPTPPPEPEPEVQPEPEPTPPPKGKKGKRK